MKRHWFRSVIGLVLVVASVLTAPGAAGGMQAARDQGAVQREPASASSAGPATAETTFTVSVMRSFEVDVPAAAGGVVAARSNAGGGYTRRLIEVHRIRGLPSSGDGPASETIVFVYVITPNY